MRSTGSIWGENLKSGKPNKAKEKNVLKLTAYTSAHGFSQMRRPTAALPTQLRGIIQTEGKTQNIKICMDNIEKAKQNELNAYLSLCHARLNLESSDSTSRPPV
jgi:hypothetical protein